MQPQIEPKITPNYQTQPSSPSTSFKIISISSLVVAVISLIVSITSIIISQNNNSLSETDAEITGTFESNVIQTTCNLPKSANDISYLYLSYNQDLSGAYISPDDTIDYYSKETNNAGDTITINKGINTDTKPIFEQLLSDGISEFTSYEYNEYPEEDEENTSIDWDWLAQISNLDSSSCEVKGNDAPPIWFTKLTDLINNKINQ